MASSIASSTICLSITFSRATASAICKSSSLLALTAIEVTPSDVGLRSTCRAGPAQAVSRGLRPGFAGAASRSDPRSARPHRRVPSVAAARCRGAGIRGSSVVGQDETGLAEIGERQARDRLLAFLDVRQFDQHRVVLDAADDPRGSACGRRRGAAISILASWPAQRSKSLARTSGRSMPGDEISR